MINPQHFSRVCRSKFGDCFYIDIMGIVDKNNLSLVSR